MSIEPLPLIYLTRTPLHVGAGASVGAIDQPIQRERHTGYPIIPGSSLKGVYRDVFANDVNTDWLFGVGDGNAKVFSAGALQFTEARLLAFPVRSARGGYAFLVSPTTLARAQRDGVLPPALALPTLPAPSDQAAITSPGSPLIICGASLVLEEYAYAVIQPDAFRAVAAAVCALAGDDPIWKQAPSRVVLISDHAMSYFARHACEVAQHVRINDETGTADERGLFNQENVPADTLFYSLVYAQLGKGNAGKAKEAKHALEKFKETLSKQPILQFGGDGTSGCGWTTVSSFNAEAQSKALQNLPAPAPTNPVAAAPAAAVVPAPAPRAAAPAPRPQNNQGQRR